jgi:hypothetical protein
LVNKTPPVNRNALIIGSITGLVLLLVLMSNCGGDDKRSGSSTTSTVTKTVTATAAPSTTTVTVSVVAEPPPSELPVLAVPPEAPLATERPPALPVPLMPQAPQAPANVYYKNCTAARAAGAAPLYVGEPGYRSGLDGDSDGVACE